MGYHLEFNCLLSVNKDVFDLTVLEVGGKYSLVKDGERLYPLNIPIEICDGEYKYYGKIAIRKLTLESGKTTLEFDVLKLFSEAEAQVYTDNFIPPTAVQA